MYNMCVYVYIYLHCMYIYIWTLSEINIIIIAQNKYQFKRLVKQFLFSHLSLLLVLIVLTFKALS